MRVPLSWLREYVELPAGVTGREVADRLIEAGLEVETVDRVGADIKGPLVVARVLSFEPEEHKNGKTIRWTSLDTGESEPRWVVCGASNYVVGDLIVAVLPGAVLPGGFEITARTTYGHVSDGMICSTRELGMGDDHSGILVLGKHEAKPGDDAVELLHLRDDVLDIAVTPDRGYCLSIRGVAREAATAYGLELQDPAAIELTGEGTTGGYPVRVEDAVGCPVFVARTVTGIDAARQSPRWMQQRLTLAGMRPISVAVDITNYVMLELGNPIHGYDRSLLTGDIVVRRAQPGEKLVTLDDKARELDPEDLLITDGSGPIGLAGVMGGASTEISRTTTDVVIEAAHFDAVTIARTSRRHKLSTEGAKRWERGVDPALPRYAAQRVADLLAELAGGTVRTEQTVIDTTEPREPVAIAVDHARNVAGAPITVSETVTHLTAVGCEVRRGGSDTGEQLVVTPPSWRPDLRDPNDFAEEVIRLYGYDKVPSVLPAPGGHGLTVPQRRRRRIAQALVGAGLTEVVAYPFIGTADLDALGLAADDERRATVLLTNPLSDEAPGLQTTVLPGLLRTAARNAGRGHTDLALFLAAAVFLPRPDAKSAPVPAVDGRPSDDELAKLYAALPEQPQHLGVVLSGSRIPVGWWGKGEPYGWADAVQTARLVAAVVGVEVSVRNAEYAPWHPGRCAEVLVGDRVVGHAGELHPKVCQAFGLPARSCATELDLDALIAAGPVMVTAVPFSSYPVAKEDVALIVAADVAAEDVRAALVEGAGELLESIRLFDTYTGDQIGAGKKSLAFALRFRAPDRTLTDAEAAEVRQAAVDVAATRFGAVHRVG